MAERSERTKRAVGYCDTAISENKGFSEAAEVATTALSWLERAEKAEAETAELRTKLEWAEMKAKRLVTEFARLRAGIQGVRDTLRLQRAKTAARKSKEKLKLN